MHLLRSAIFLFVLLTIPLRANLGDTVEECVKRYGVPIGYSEAGSKSPFGTVAFTAGKYTLVVFLLATKEVGARVSKTDKSAFADAEIQNIMTAENVPGSTWNSAPSSDPSCQQWNRSDKATFIYDKDKHMIVITSPAMADAAHMPILPPTATPDTNAVPAEKPHYAN
jgi:hypothetical protein